MSDNNIKVNCLSQKDKEELEKAYKIIKQVKDRINLDYEEFFILNTTLEYLQNTINYK